MPTTSVIDSETEHPMSIDEAPSTWSENYCFDGFDPDADAGFWLHLGRWSRERSIWREQSKVYLPDGSVLLWKAFGTGREAANGPGAGSLGFECLEPGRRWRLRFDGAARRATFDQLAAGPLADGPVARLVMELDFVSDDPIWDLGDDAVRQVWCSEHYEQHGVVSGTITVDGTPIALRHARSYRDHSRGPRSLKSQRLHAWVHGQAADGRSFGLFHMQVAEENRSLGRAFVVVDGQLHEAEVSVPPFARAVEELRRPYRFELRSPALGTLAIEAEPDNSVISSIHIPYEKLHGVAPDAPLISCHQMTRFSFDGSPAAGLTERAFAV
jgi:hypothetical protein